jgi:hypothetical protein
MVRAEVRAEVPAVVRAVPQDGNELNCMENLNGKKQTNTKIYFSPCRGIHNRTFE